MKGNMGRHKTQVGDCNFDGCNRPKHCRGWCRPHYQQWSNGKELTPVGSTYASNRGPSVCKIEDCELKVTARGMCPKHYYQWHYKDRRNATISKKGEITLAQGFSTERHCSKCNQTKDWKEYHLEQKMCADCWRKHLSVEHSVYPDDRRTGRKEPAPFEERWQQLLDDIATQIQ